VRTKRLSRTLAPRQRARGKEQQIMPKQIFQRPAPVPRNSKVPAGKGFGQTDFGRKKGKAPKPAKPAEPAHKGPAEDHKDT
jgi:hypothetical protein